VGERGKLRPAIPPTIYPAREKNFQEGSKGYAEPATPFRRGERETIKKVELTALTGKGTQAGKGAETRGDKKVGCTQPQGAAIAKREVSLKGEKTCINAEKKASRTKQEGYLKYSRQGRN